jgi:hypothetical protein
MLKLAADDLAKSLCKPLWKGNQISPQASHGLHFVYPFHQTGSLFSHHPLTATPL